MPYFPFFMNIEGESCLVVGGGNTALRKIEKLLPFKPEIHVVAKNICEEIRGLNSVEVSEREFRDDDIAGVRFVIAATNNRDLNARIAMLCKNAKIPCNSVDDPENIPKNWGFFFPALVHYGDVVVGISTGGKSPVLAAKLRGEIENFIDPKIAEICERMGELRSYVKDRFPNEAARKKAFKSALECCFENDTVPGLEELIDYLKEQI